MIEQVIEKNTTEADFVPELIANLVAELRPENPHNTQQAIRLDSNAM